MMFKTFVVTVWALFATSLAGIALSHPGGLAKDDCHVDNKFGDRHWHESGTRERAGECIDDSGVTIQIIEPEPFSIDAALATCEAQLGDARAQLDDVRGQLGNARTQLGNARSIVGNARSIAQDAALRDRTCSALVDRLKGDLDLSLTKLSNVNAGRETCVRQQATVHARLNNFFSWQLREAVVDLLDCLKIGN